MMQVPCAMCGSTRNRVMYRAQRVPDDPARLFSAAGGVRGMQTVVRCLDCGLIYVNPRPDAATVMRGYAEAAGDDYLGGGPGREKTFLRGLAHLEKRAGRRGRILDVGCADGAFVKVARDAGWNAAGVEPCARLAEHGRRMRGVVIATSDLAGAAFADESFDAVTLWDVLEHAVAPTALLRECRRVLRRGGLILVGYPDIGSLQARLAGRFWWFLLSNHLYYFTRGTIAACLHVTGFSGCEFRMHWQWLPLAHLVRISRIYLGRPAEIIADAAARTRIGRMLVPYYAAQTVVTARRE